MVALSFEKALLQLKIQRKNQQLGGLTLSDSNMVSACPQISSRPSSGQPISPISQQSSGPLNSTKIRWAQNLAVTSSHIHVPWAVSQPAKPILKVREYESADLIAQTGHWSDHTANDGLVPPPLRMTSKPEILQQSDNATEKNSPIKQRCTKILSQKRSRQVAFAL